MRYLVNYQIKFLIHIIECVNWYLYIYALKCTLTCQDWLSHMSNHPIQYVLRWDETQLMSKKLIDFKSIFLISVTM